MTCYALGHFDGRLVVAVEEIHLEALHAHLRILAASLVEVFVEHVEHRPQHHVNAFLAAIADESRQVDGLDGIHDITLR